MCIKVVFFHLWTWPMVWCCVGPCFYHTFCLEGKPWSWQYRFRIWLRNQLTKQTRTKMSAMVFNKVQLSWPSATVWSCLASLQLLCQCATDVTVCNCNYCLQLSWQSETVGISNLCSLLVLVCFCQQRCRALFIF